MDLYTVCVDDLGGTADIPHIKTGFALLDEVLHLATFAIEADQILRRRIHVRNDEGVHVGHLSIRLFNLANYTPRVSPWSSLVFEFTIPTGSCS